MKKTAFLLTCVFLSLLVGVAQNRAYTIGDNVSDFKLKNSDDKMISLSSFVNAKGYVLVFTNSLAADSQTSENMLNDLYKRLSILNYPVIVIAPMEGDNASYADNSTSQYTQQPYKYSNVYRFPYLLDANGDVYSQFGITYVPQIYVVERTGQGNILRYISNVNNNSINEIEDVVTNLVMKNTSYFNENP